MENKKFILFDDNGIVKDIQIADGMPYYEEELNNKGYIEVSEDDYKEYLNGAINIDGKATILIPPSNMLKPVYDSDKKEWTDEATLNEIQAFFMEKIQIFMDKKALTYGFDNIYTAGSYQNSKVDKFREDALTVLDWRDQVWEKAYEIADDVLAGGREIPRIEEIFSELPQLEDGDRATLSEKIATVKLTQE